VASGDKAARSFAEVTEALMQGTKSITRLSQAIVEIQTTPKQSAKPMLALMLHP
jgi:hypothetical protein